jgi:hypothetical protein
MTASTAKSSLITNMEASPVVMGTYGQTGNGLKMAHVVNNVATTSIDEADDIFLFLPVPAGAVPTSLMIYNDDLDSHGTPQLAVDVGLYYGADVPGQTSGTAVDVDCFASAITTLQAANTSGVEILFEALDIAKIGKPLWELGGLTSNPGGNLLIGMKVTTAAATAAAGHVALVLQYV